MRVRRLEWQIRDKDKGAAGWRRASDTGHEESSAWGGL